MILPITSHAGDCLFIDELFLIAKKYLNSFFEWSSKWQMSLNTRKCNTLRVTTEKNPIVHTFYSMGTDKLETVSHHPYLGVELISSLKWTHHINMIAARANKTL